MTREQAKAILPIIQAYAEGKIIQYRTSNNEWVDTYKPSFSDSSSNYRIKPEPKYRPFKDREECWNEMLKHQPFGWIKNKNSNDCVNITSVYCGKETKVRIEISPRLGLSAEHSYNQFEFIDGTPFGIKEE